MFLTIQNVYNHSIWEHDLLKFTFYIDIRDKSRNEWFNTQNIHTL